MSEVLVVGTVGIDTIETPHGIRQEIMGGSAVHAGMAARFFVKPKILGCVGGDYPTEHRRFLSQHLDASLLVERPERTFRWVGRYAGAMERAETLKTELGVVATFKPHTAVTMLPRFIFLANGDPEHQTALMERAPKDSVKVVDTMDFWITTKRNAVLEALRAADIVILNADEAASITGEHGAVRSAHALVERFGVKRVIVKKGEHGSIFVGPEGFRSTPAYPVRQVVDPTGAGDAFAGALVGVIASKGDLTANALAEGMWYGTVVSSFIVEAFGCDRLAEIDRTAVDSRLKELHSFTRVPSMDFTVSPFVPAAPATNVVAPSAPAVLSAGSSEVRDPSLAEQGRMSIELAEANMKALVAVRERFAASKPLVGLTIGLALHVTKETAVLVRTLVAGGATVAITGCNPLSTQDDVAAALAREEGVSVWAHKGESREDYYRFLNYVIDSKPNITIDDGCDLVTEIHTKRTEALEGIIGGCEETSTGVIRLHAMEREVALKYPVVAVNDNKTKHLIDNYYGTGQSTLDGLTRASNLLLAGKTLVLVGYGSCGKGVSLRGRGMGANVIVCEVDPFRALQAVMDGFRVMPIAEAARIGDVFITLSGNKHVIRMEHVAVMKDGAVLANSGHFDNEIDLAALEKEASSKRRIRPNYFDEYTVSGKRVYVAGEGRLVNLACAEGHPSEVMSLSFCGQALACEWLVKNRSSLQSKVYTLPPEIDEDISKLALKALGVSCDVLTSEQQAYLQSWQEGT